MTRNEILSRQGCSCGSTGAAAPSPIPRRPHSKHPALRQSSGSKALLSGGAVRQRPSAAWYESRRRCAGWGPASTSWSKCPRSRPFMVQMPAKQVGCPSSLIANQTTPLFLVFGPGAYFCEAVERNQATVLAIGRRNCAGRDVATRPISSS
jgi:hypothetical protein